jgi:hypothetical protein
MGDKSPKHVTAKKPSTKTIKEKRQDKKDAAAKSMPASQVENLTHGRKHF